MISYNVLITIVLIFFKSYYADVTLDFNRYEKCSIDLEIIGFDNTNTFRNIVLLRSFGDRQLFLNQALEKLNENIKEKNDKRMKEAMNKDPILCDDSVNKDECDEKFYTDTASLPDDSEPLLNHASQNLNEKITHESINVESNSEICDDSVNKDKIKEKDEKTASLPATRKDPSNEICDDSVNKDECDEKFYTDTASLPAYISEYCDVLIEIKCFVDFRTPLQYCELLNSLREKEKNFFNKLANYFKDPFDVQGCKNAIIEKYYDEFNAYKNFIITMNILDPDMKEYTLEGLNEFALQYFNQEKSIIKSERNSTNDYYTKGAGKWCYNTIKVQQKPQTEESDTSSASGTSGTCDTNVISEASDTSGTNETIAPSAPVDFLL